MTVTDVITGSHGVVFDVRVLETFQTGDGYHRCNSAAQGIGLERRLIHPPETAGRRIVTKRTCNIEGCDRSLVARGWCAMHWRRWRTTGDPGSAELLIQRRGKFCSVEDCQKKAYARTWCKMHYMRWWTHGDVSIVLPGNTGRGELNATWRGDDVSYVVIHERLYRSRGKASNHSCVECGGRAKDWAYDHKDPNERIDPDDPKARPYSTDLIHYRPLCRSCHTRSDFARRRSEAVS